MVNQKISKNENIIDTYNHYPNVIGEKLLRIRAIIYEEAERNSAVGQIEESLKWGQPSYVGNNRSGTPIRLGMEKKSLDTFGLYVNCSTNLIETIRHIYGDSFKYDGNRGILFKVGDEIPDDALRHMISLALTYHLK